MARADGGTFVGFDTVVFGGGGSPLIWGRAAALLGRSGQSLFVTSELIVEIDVDDPWILLRGSPVVRKRNAVILFLWWHAMGPMLAFTKLSGGRKVQRIGAVITLISDKELKIGLAGKDDCGDERGVRGAAAAACSPIEEATAVRRTRLVVRRLGQGDGAVPVSVLGSYC